MRSSGGGAFRNEVVWYYKNASRGKRQRAKAHDLILWYAPSREYTFNRDRVLAPFESGMTEWRYTKGGQRDAEMPKGKTPDDVIVLPSLNAMARERVGYPTQKPLALLEHVVEASSNPGDVVLDPFCGCATACVAAEKLDRQWVGIDISPKAAELVNVRLASEMGSLFHHGFVTTRTDIPARTDVDAPKNYRQNKHVLYGQQEGRCGGCATLFEFRNFEVDHVIPRSKGGTDHLGNLQLLCGHCNRVKGDRDQAYLVARLAEMAT